jgi:hypothetical protein
MKQGMMKSAALSCFCVILGTVASLMYLHKSAPLSPGTHVAIAGVPWAKAPRTIVVGMRLGCPYCERSIPFFLQVAASPALTKGQAQLVIVMPDQRDIASHYLKRVGLGAATLITSPIQAIGSTSTPTMLIVNSKANIQHSWVGMLPQVEQTKLLNTLN